MRRFPFQSRTGKKQTSVLGQPEYALSVLKTARRRKCSADELYNLSERLCLCLWRFVDRIKHLTETQGFTSNCRINYLYPCAITHEDKPCTYKFLFLNKILDCTLKSLTTLYEKSSSFYLSYNHYYLMLIQNPLIRLSHLHYTDYLLLPVFSQMNTKSHQQSRFLASGAMLETLNLSSSCSPHLTFGAKKKK